MSIDQICYILYSNEIHTSPKPPLRLACHTYYDPVPSVRLHISSSPSACTLPFPPPDHRPPYAVELGPLVVLAVSMDTPQPPSIVNQPLKRKERSPSPTRRTPGHTSTAGSRPSQTSLPPIRDFLPQPDTAQLNERYHPTNNRQQTGPAFSAGPSAGIPRLDFLPPPPAQPPAERTHSGIIGDSDGDGDSEQAARPKQKRRRQALSCTECKRRKIKCDRAHPCTPCIRRGDQNKCQWHVIEPVDKYVSRAEYDELKARVDHLETLLLSRPQLPSAFAPQSQQGPEPTSSSSSQAQPKPAKPVGLPPTRLLAAAAPGQQQGCGAISTAPAPAPMPIMPYSSIGLPPPNSSPVGRTSSTTTATMTTTVTTLPSIASLANGPLPYPMGAARLHREHSDHEHREQQHQPRRNCNCNSYDCNDCTRTSSSRQKTAARRRSPRWASACAASTVSFSKAQRPSIAFIVSPTTTAATTTSTADSAE